MVFMQFTGDIVLKTQPKRAVLCKWVGIVLCVCLFICGCILLWNSYYQNTVVYPTFEQININLTSNVFSVVTTDLKADNSKYQKAYNHISFLVEAKAAKPMIQYDYLIEYQGVYYRLILFDFKNNEGANTFFDSFEHEAKTNIYNQAKTISPFELSHKMEYMHYYSNGDLSGPMTQMWRKNNYVYLLLADASENNSAFQLADAFKCVIVL